MSIIVAGVANLLMRREGAPDSGYVLSQTVGDQKLYFRTERMGKTNFIGVRPALVFTMVNKAEDATKFDWRVTAWRYRQALHRASDHASEIFIEPMPQLA